MIIDVEQARPGRRGRLHEIVFESDTRAGKAFDVGLLIAIFGSIAVVMLESVPSIRARYGPWLLAAEWGFTVLFTLEYVLRLIAVQRPLLYARSFYGFVDLVAILPSYISLLVPGAQSLLVVRVLRLLRVFRVLKLASFLGPAEVLMHAMRASRQKITVFLLTVVAVVVIVGTLMYLIEGQRNGFDSIPSSIYWAIVTITTVGFGDITPRTVPGQALASILMVTGYAIIAVPTGIVSIEIANASRKRHDFRGCPGCGIESHDVDAIYCKRCAHPLGD